MKSSKMSISFYDAHLEIIDGYAKALNIRAKNVRSTTLQKIVEEWAEDRGQIIVTSASGRPLYSNVHPICIGYLRLTDLMTALDITQTVYVATHVEKVTGTVPAQRIDHYFIMVTQPDAQQRVHYCRIPVAQLVYHHGVAFAPDAAVQVEDVEEKRRQIEAWLVGEGYQVYAGMVGVPKGIRVVEGVFGFVNL